MHKKNKEKIERIHKKLMNRLPKQHQCSIKIFSTVYNMIRAEANRENMEYDDCVRSYDRMCKRADKEYINSKYMRDNIEIHRTHEAFETLAFSGNPIHVALDTLGICSELTIAFTILHEIGHNYYNKKIKNLGERIADEFAGRWMRILINERILKPIK